MPFCHLQIKALRCPYPDNWITNQPCPEAPKTIGDHIRKRRLERHILQESLAERFGVNVETLKNWERGVEQPMIRHLPAVIGFLGLDPDPEPNEIPKRIAYARRQMGWTQEELAKSLKVGTVTVGRWEAGTSAAPKDALTNFQQHLGDRFQLIPSFR